MARQDTEAQSKALNANFIRESVEAFWNLIEGAHQRKLSPQEMRDAIKTIGEAERILGPDGFADWINTLGGGKTNPLSSGTPVRNKPVKWKIHWTGSGKNRKKDHWTASAHGFELVIRHTKTPHEKVVFEGLLNDALVIRDKLLDNAKTSLAAEAYRRSKGR